MLALSAWQNRPLILRVFAALPQIKSRSADDFEDVGGGSLLLKEVVVSLNNRTFSIPVTAWSAKVLRSWTCASKIILAVPGNKDRSDDLLVADHRHTQATAITTDPRSIFM